LAASLFFPGAFVGGIGNTSTNKRRNAQLNRIKRKPQ
jgi:hypothetical protein